ncbi:hypothetical protein BURMUCF2_A0427 [Burkholderia multivorans CF2]|nr:hypothetical protein BURMUCF2_A0427 [Burkholderia multivorans CF2]
MRRTTHARLLHASPRCEPDRSIAKRALAVNPLMHWIAECAPSARRIRAAA